MKAKRKRTKKTGKSPAKRRAAPKKRAKARTKKAAPRRAAKRRARKAAPRRAAKSAPRRNRRKRKANMNERQGDKRYKRRSRKKARKSNPSGRRRSAMRSTGRRYGKRRSNGGGLRLGNPVGEMGNLLVLGVSALGGFVTAEFADRYVATRPGAKSPNGGKDAFTGMQAMVEINAPPDGMRYAVQGGVVAGFLGLAYWANKKSHKTAAYALTGAALGAGVHIFAQLWYDVIVPMFAKPSADPAKPSFFGDRIYPELSTEKLKAAADAAKALRTAGAPTMGRPAAQGPTGQPRVGRPAAAATVGCGMDNGSNYVIAQLKAQNEALAAQVAALHGASQLNDGPETRVPATAKPAVDNVVPFTPSHAVEASFARFQSR